eukprot:EG_transcript_17988
MARCRMPDVPVVSPLWCRAGLFGACMMLGDHEGTRPGANPAETPQPTDTSLGEHIESVQSAGGAHGLPIGSVRIICNAPLDPISAHGDVHEEEQATVHVRAVIAAPAASATPRNRTWLVHSPPMGSEPSASRIADETEVGRPVLDAAHVAPIQKTSSSSSPTSPEKYTHWLQGIARQDTVDFHSELLRGEQRALLRREERRRTTVLQEESAASDQLREFHEKTVRYQSRPSLPPNPVAMTEAQISECLTAKLAAVAHYKHETLQWCTAEDELDTAEEERAEIAKCRRADQLRIVLAAYEVHRQRVRRAIATAERRADVFARQRVTGPSLLRRTQANEEAERLYLEGIEWD